MKQGIRVIHSLKGHQVFSRRGIEKTWLRTINQGKPKLWRSQSSHFSREFGSFGVDRRLPVNKRRFQYDMIELSVIGHDDKRRIFLVPREEWVESRICLKNMLSELTQVFHSLSFIRTIAHLWVSPNRVRNAEASVEVLP